MLQTPHSSFSSYIFLSFQFSAHMLAPWHRWQCMPLSPEVIVYFRLIADTDICMCVGGRTCTFWAFVRWPLVNICISGIARVGGLVFVSLCHVMMTNGETYTSRGLCLCKARFSSLGFGCNINKWRVLSHFRCFSFGLSMLTFNCLVLAVVP